MARALLALCWTRPGSHDRGAQGSPQSAPLGGGLLRREQYSAGRRRIAKRIALATVDVNRKTGVIDMAATGLEMSHGQQNVRTIRSVRPVSSLVLGLFAGVAGSLTLMWVIFLGWLAFGAMRLALDLIIS